MEPAEKVYVLHENQEWFPPFAGAFEDEGIPYEEWLLDGGVLDLDHAPPAGVFWSRMSASSHTRGHIRAKDHARAVLSWLEAHGRRVVNGRRVLELEMSKVDQLATLRAAGFDVPRTIAVSGDAHLAEAARWLPAPFVVKPNQGGKGLGVRRFDTVEAFDGYVDSADYEPPIDGIALLQEYLEPMEPLITRVELVGGEFLYALTADTARGGFQLCPADACAVDPVTLGSADGSSQEPGLFTLRKDFDVPIVGRYLDFARRHGIEVAGFELIETADGRQVTYDVNTNTNYNSQVDAAAERSGPREVARFLGGLLDREGRPQ
jgi:hypothetical protein